MKKFWIIGPIAIIILAYPFFLFYLHDFSRDFWSVDACFDHGGCWDYEARVCRKDEPNAQDLCTASKGRGAEEGYEKLIQKISK